MAALSLAAPPTAAQVGTLFNREGYRIAHYRAPAHRAPAGVVRIAPAAAAQLRPDVDALFIDVLPAEGGQRQADGLWRLARPHESIPGARWFPEAGRGELADDVEGWFLAGIGRLSHGRRDRPIILFCLADCWMSWNAARRLKAQGYPQVWWLAEGVDGWRDLGLPLAPVTPGGGVAR
nr:rhodanese-like domain-containing protein [Sphingobium lactosutens]